MNYPISVRFEITEGKKSLFEDIRYTASNYKPPSSFHGLSYAEVASNSIPGQKERANCLGFRTPIQYTIETIAGKNIKKEMSKEEEENPSSGAEVSEKPSSIDTPKPIGQTIRFVYGNPSVETFEGVLHLYKDNQSVEDCSSSLILMIAVPATKATQDILQFLGPVSIWLEQIRIIRDSTPNQYMVLMKFKNQRYAVDFYQNFNGKSWNSLESEVVHLVYTSAVELLTTSEGGSLPVVGVTELPTCPVCLERMDESVDSILTILCNHSFHGSCLVKWTDTSCPVCRYIQTPEQDQENVCVQCDAQQDLWICLICGHVGCGRYLEGHAYEHYKLTHHTYSMQLGANRVWDYAGDSYVHRLVQSSGDGKIVQVTNENETSAEDKNDALQLEYTYILTSQLETQRLYFQEKLDQIESESKQQQGLLRENLTEQESRLEEVLNRLDKLEKEKKSLEQKNSILTATVNRSKKELEEEKQYNHCLRKNQDEWNQKCSKLEDDIKNKDLQIQSLEEQVRDVMFSLDAQMRLKEEATEEELKSSSISVDASASSRSQRRKGRKK